jgi:peroxiredoxin
MRLFWLGLPAGLALASGGLLLYTQAQRPHVRMQEVLTGLPKHPVTVAMTAETGAKTRKPAPAFSLKDVAGEEVAVASPGMERPQFVYFVLDGCPCSFEAEPLFHDLYERHQDRIDFVSITDAEPVKAKRWWQQMMVPYPVVADPKKEVIHAFGAKNSVYSALVARDGTIVKMWPGYSVGILKEINQKMADAGGVPAKPFDTKYAPKEESSGCAF